MINTGSKGRLNGTPDIANPYSGGGAQNAAKALGSIGRSLSDMGDTGMAIAQDLQRSRDAKVENESINFWEEEMAKHEADMMKVKDPDERVQKTEMFLGSLKTRGYEGKTMSKRVRYRLEMKWGNLQSRYKARAYSQAAQLDAEQAATSIGLRLDRAAHIGTMADVGDILNDSVEQGIMSRAKADSIGFKMEAQLRTRDFNALLESDPFKAQESVSGFGFSESELPRMKGKAEKAAKRRNRELVADQSDSFINAVLEEEADESHLEEMTPNASTLERRKLRKFARDYKSEKRQAEIKNPSFQSQLFGELEVAIASFDASTDKNDKSIVDMRIMANQITQPEYKKMFNDRITERLNGHEEMVNDKWSWAKKSIVETQKQRLAKIEKPRAIEFTVADYLRDGFLTKESIVKAGWSEDAAETVMEATEHIDGSGTFNDQQVTKLAQWKKLRELQNERVLPAKGVLSPWEEEVFANLLTKGENEIAYTHTSGKEWEAEQKRYNNERADVMRKMGVFYMRMQELKKSDPNISPEKLEAKLKSEGVDVWAGDDDDTMQFEESSLLLPPMGWNQ